MDDSACAVKTEDSSFLGRLDAVLSEDAAYSGRALVVFAQLNEFDVGASFSETFYAVPKGKGVITYTPITSAGLSTDTAAKALLQIRDEKRIPPVIGAALQLQANTDVVANILLSGATLSNTATEETELRMGLYEVDSGKAVQQLEVWESSSKCKQLSDICGAYPDHDYYVVIAVASDDVRCVSDRATEGSHRFHTFVQALSSGDAETSGTALVVLGHSSLRIEDGFTTVPQGSGVVTYTSPGSYLNSLEAYAAINTMRLQHFIPATVGRFSMLPNDGTTANYSFSGDDRKFGSACGLYKVDGGKSCERLQCWDSSSRRMNLKKLFTVMRAHGCDYIIALGCKAPREPEEVLAINPTNINAWGRLATRGGGTVSGVHYSEQECRDAQTKLCRDAVVANPNDCWAWHSIARFIDLSTTDCKWNEQVFGTDPPTCVTCYRRILSSEPRDVAGHFMLATSLGAGKKTRELDESTMAEICYHCEETIRLGGGLGHAAEQAHAWYGCFLVCIALKSGRDEVLLDKAEMVLRGCLQFDPNHGLALENMAVILMKRLNIKGVNYYLQRMLDLIGVVRAANLDAPSPTLRSSLSVLCGTGPKGRTVDQTLAAAERLIDWGSESLEVFGCTQALEEWKSYWKAEVLKLKKPHASSAEAESGPPSDRHNGGTSAQPATGHGSSKQNGVVFMMVGALLGLVALRAHSQLKLRSGA